MPGNCFGGGVHACHASVQSLAAGVAATARVQVRGTEVPILLYTDTSIYIYLKHTANRIKRMHVLVLPYH